MTTAFYLPLKKTIVISNLMPEDSIILCSKDTKLARIHWSMLRQFKLTTGHYMMSDELLMTISRIFRFEYEDLWNKIHLDDQIKQITNRRSPTRTDDWEVDA